MKLEQLRPNLYELPRDEAFVLFSKYYEERSKDLEIMTVRVQKPAKKAKGKKRAKKNTDDVKVSASDLAILKKLGLV